METSITSETISQQTICGDLNNIEIANDTEPKLTQSREQMEIKKTRINVKNAREYTLNTFHLRKWHIQNFSMVTIRGRRKTCSSRNSGREMSKTPI